jgi:hypothetical protein
MTEIQYQRWKQIRAKGIVQYLLVRGILYRGAPLGFIMAIIQFISPSRAYHHPIFHCLVMFGAFGVPFGLVYGYGTWEAKESIFKRHKSEDDHVD